VTFAMPARPTTAIPTSGASPVRFPVGRLAASLLAVGAGTGLVAGGIAGAVTAGFDAPAAALGTGVVLAATGLGLAILAFSKPRPIFGWASLVMVASIVRLVVSLALALLVSLALEPNRAVFWSAFLAGSMAVLVVETVLARTALLNITPEQPHTESA
jgi:hypothetical protein